MEIAIVYDSVTGNTRNLAEAIDNECKNAKVYKKYDENILNADLVFVGSWTDKGSPSDKIKLVYRKLHNKKIFVFGTCGFGGDEKYYKLLFENTRKYINEDLIKEEKKKEIYEAIGKLKKSYQIVIYLKDIEGLKYKEISRILNKTVPQLKMMTHRARKSLEKTMRKEVKKNVR